MKLQHVAAFNDGSCANRDFLPSLRHDPGRNTTHRIVACDVLQRMPRQGRAIHKYLVTGDRDAQQLTIVHFHGLFAQDLHQHFTHGR